MARSLNRVELIGNLTRDPELRYTPQGTAVCTFSVATNRGWTTDSGEKKEDVEFHKIVAWNKLAELCSQFLSKGRKVFVEGRLSTRSWTAQDGSNRTTTEIVITDMLILDPKREGARESDEVKEEQSSAADEAAEQDIEQPKPSKAKKKEAEVAADDEVNPDDIPF